LLLLNHNDKSWSKAVMVYHYNPSALEAEAGG
jgi:hypothetical protein